jgi:hypothetical protein
MTPHASADGSGVGPNLAAPPGAGAFFKRTAAGSTSHSLQPPTYREYVTGFHKRKVARRAAAQAAAAERARLARLEQRAAKRARIREELGLARFDTPPPEEAVDREGAGGDGAKGSAATVSRRVYEGTGIVSGGGGGGEEGGRGGGGQGAPPAPALTTTVVVAPIALDSDEGVDDDGVGAASTSGSEEEERAEKEEEGGDDAPAPGGGAWGWRNEPAGARAARSPPRAAGCGDGGDGGHRPGKKTGKPRPADRAGRGRVNSRR